MVKILEQKHNIVLIKKKKFYYYPCIITICLNICPDCCRGLVIYETMAKQKAFPRSICLENLLHGLQLRSKISREGKNEEEEEGNCV